jgi:hypothetical protein
LIVSPRWARERLAARAARRRADDMRRSLNGCTVPSSWRTRATLLLTTSAFIGLALHVPDVSADRESATGAVSGPVTPQIELAVVSEDPYTNTTSYHQTEVEPDSFAFGSTIVAAFMAGKFENRGASNLGWSASTNAGATWTDGFLPATTIRATPPGPWRRVVDPAVAYDAAHDTWLIIGLGARSLRPIKFDLPL